MTTSQTSHWSDVFFIRPKRSCRRVGIGCLLLFLMLLSGLCALLTLLISPDNAVALGVVEPQPLQIWLLVDNSNSMFEKDGIGSDPGLLRLDAARLFLTYLGVDEPGLVHQAGVIFFGSTAQTAVPLTPLTDEAQRATLFAQIAAPARLGWTDHLAALQLAQEEIVTAGSGSRPAVILLTDGKPEPAGDLLPAEQANYIADLETQSNRFRQANIPLFIILLANETTKRDETIASTWLPLWQSMSQATTPGHLYVARAAADLPDIYHDIVVALTGRQSAGMVLSTAVFDMTEATLTVPPDLAQLTLVISKSDPDQEVTIDMAAAETLTATSPRVRRAGANGAPEEVWVIEQPPAGSWTVRIEGPGEVTIWQDYKTLPATPPPTAVPVSSTAVSMPTKAVASIAPEPTHLPSAPPVLATPSVTPVPVSSATTTRDVVPMASMLSPTIVPQPSGPPLAPWRWLAWLLGGGLLAIALLGGFFWLRQARQPRVAGSIRILTVNGRLPRTIDLDDRRQMAVTIGKPPADIPLPGSAGRATIRPGLLVNGTPQMLLEGLGEMALNDTPVTRPTPLFDMAVIDLGGGVKIRYEDLRLRRAVRQNGWRSSQKSGI